MKSFITIVALFAHGFLFAQCPLDGKGLPYKKTGNVTIKTGTPLGNYVVGSWNNDVGMSFDFTCTGNDIQYWGQYNFRGSATNGSHMLWVKKLQGYNPTYPQRVDDLVGEHIARFDARFEAPCGGSTGGRFGLDIWTGPYDNCPRPLKTEIMLDEHYWAGNIDSTKVENFRGYFEIDGATWQDGQHSRYLVFGPYYHGSVTNGHYSFVVAREKARFSGTLDVRKVMAFLRTLPAINGDGDGKKNDEFSNDLIIEIRVGTEMNASWDHQGIFYIDEVDIPDLNVDASSVAGAAPQPRFFQLRQNYPNPFNPSTTISFDIPRGSDVKLRVFDLHGRLVSTLIDEHKAAGRYTVDFANRELPSGAYLYKLTAGEFSQTRKMLLIR